MHEIGSDPDHADDDQVDGDDVIEELRHQQDEDAGNEGDNRLHADRYDVHARDLRTAGATASTRWGLIGIRLASPAGRPHLITGALCGASPASRLSCPAPGL